MAEINAPDLIAIGLFSTVSLAFLTFHIYKFDGFQCLILRKKDWFRCLLIYMLVLSNLSFIIWSICWGYIKLQLGWVKLGPSGARPWPSALFPARYTSFNTPLTILFGICYGLQACLTVEEALYFYYIMRAFRRPQAAVPFLKSNFFRAWIAASVAIGVVQHTVPWVAFDGDLRRQLARELLAGGCLELVVLIASTIIVLKFPKFLRAVGTTAGPDVRARLFFYHQLNKCRTLFRFTFSLPLIILGIDGLSNRAIISMNPLATDVLATLIGASLAAVMMIFIVLYLPRNPPSSVQNRVMVGRQNQSGFALISLLREGGHWDEADIDLVPEAAEASRGNEAPFSQAQNRVSWNMEDEEKRHSREGAKSAAPRLLVDSFTSPIAVHAETQLQRPVQILMQVEQQTHKD